jgi:hypothetical protein
MLQLTRNEVGWRRLDASTLETSSTGELTAHQHLEFCLVMLLLQLFFWCFFGARLRFTYHICFEASVAFVML